MFHRHSFPTVRPTFFSTLRDMATLSRAVWVDYANYRHQQRRTRKLRRQRYQAAAQATWRNDGLYLIAVGALAVALGLLVGEMTFGLMSMLLRLAGVAP